jgi:membrane carboxypeptidase/penicillin-binding protein PbpC
VTIRQALGNSLNIPAVKTLALVGTDKALQTASDMGITTLTDKERYGLSLVLGGGEVEPLEMAGAYGVFANGGTYMPTSPVLKITDTKGKTLLDRTDPKDGRQVLDPQAAYEINSVLADFEAKKPTFTFAKNVLTLSDRPVAAKTGTTNGYRDAWTIGYTPQYVTAVWVGNNDNSPMTPSGGAIAAAPLWHDVMASLHKGLPVEQFNKPDGIQEVTVDKLSNKLPVSGSDPIKDIFASWQVPKDPDDVHVQVRVCKENGLLAGSDIPDQLAELRTYVNIRSEMPNNPNWEGPVQAWAASNGLTNKPPTQNCTLGNNTQPTITITAPSDGQTVSGSFTITANASAPSGVSSVDFLVDNTVIASVSAAPYQTTYNADLLSQGSHTIAATVRSVSGSTATSTITITVNKDTTPPSNITNFNGISGPQRVALSWTNPSDSDFALVRIYVYLDSTSALVSTVEVAKPGASTLVNSLQSGKAYRFLAKSVDTTGNESSGVTIFVTPL